MPSDTRTYRVIVFEVKKKKRLLHASDMQVIGGKKKRQDIEALSMAADSVRQEWRGRFKALIGD